MEERKVFVIVLVLAAVMIGMIGMTSYDPVPASIARAQIGIAAAPVTASPTGMVISTVVQYLVVGALVLIAGMIGWKAWEQRKSRQGGWVSGPGAKWGRTPVQKQPTLMDLLTMQAYQQMRQQMPPMYEMDNRKEARF